MKDLNFDGKVIGRIATQFALTQIQRMNDVVIFLVK